MDLAKLKYNTVPDVTIEEVALMQEIAETNNLNAVIKLITLRTNLKLSEARSLSLEQCIDVMTKIAEIMSKSPKSKPTKFKIVG